MVKIKIVEDIKEEMRKDDERLNKIEKGKYVKADKERVLIMTPKTFASVFSPGRLKLLRVIKKIKVHSVQELATMLERPYEAVYRDIKYLEGLGLLETKIENHHRIPIMHETVKVPALI